MSRWLKAIDRTLETTLVVLITAMVANVVWQVVTRFVLRDPSAYTEELARFLLIWTGLLGACLAWRRKLHLSIELFRKEGEERAAIFRWSRISASVAFAGLVLVVGGGRLVALTLELEQRSAALGWPLGYVYLAVPLSGALLLFFIAAQEWERRQ